MKIKVNIKDLIYRFDWLDAEIHIYSYIEFFIRGYLLELVEYELKHAPLDRKGEKYLKKILKCLREGGVVVEDIKAYIVSPEEESLKAKIKRKIEDSCSQA